MRTSSKNIVVLGVDIGKKAAICMMTSDGDVEFNPCDGDKLARQVDGSCEMYEPSHIAMEDCYGFYANRLNRMAGHVEGYCLKPSTPCMFISDPTFLYCSPGSWKKNLGYLIPGMNGRTSKEKYTELIRAHLNSSRLTEDECAAYGIAYWCLTQAMKDGE